MLENQFGISFITNPAILSIFPVESQYYIIQIIEHLVILKFSIQDYFFKIPNIIRHVADSVNQKNKLIAMNDSLKSFRNSFNFWRQNCPVALPFPVQEILDVSVRFEPDLVKIINARTQCFVEDLASYFRPSWIALAYREGSTKYVKVIREGAISDINSDKREYMGTFVLFFPLLAEAYILIQSLKLVTQPISSLLESVMKNSVSLLGDESGSNPPNERLRIGKEVLKNTWPAVKEILEIEGPVNIEAIIGRAGELLRPIAMKLK
jgi:hypothetical protein